MNAIQTTDQFLSSLGVNVHVEYTDGKYANSGLVIKDLAFLGIDHVRDAVLSPSNQGQASYDALAAAGIKFDLFFQGSALDSTMKLVDAFLVRHPGAISMIEGPNEVNNYPIHFNGLSGNDAAVAYQGALFSSVHADAALAGVPVANLTSWPDLAAPADLANFHSYPKNGAEPSATLSHDAAAQSAAEGDQPLVMTEGGYTTLTSSNYFGGVDQLTQAKMLLNLFADNAKSGVQQSYVYELLDAYSDSTNSDPNKHFGLFNLDNSPKTAATAIHNLTTILSDDVGGVQGSVNPAFESSGLPESASLLSLVKKTGVLDLLVWDEPSIWDNTNHQAVPAAGHQASLHFDDLSDVTIFDPLLSDRPLVSALATHDVSFTLTDHPLIIEASGASSAADSTTQGTVSLGLSPEPGATAGSSGADVMSAAGGGSMMFGMGGDDSLSGAAGDDCLFGNVGADTLTGGGGADSLFGGRDADILFGDAGNDSIFGNIGADTLRGGTGADSLWGGQDNDQLFGDAGDDRLSGDLGDDTLTGGAGSDTFVFGPGGGHDVVTDFTKGEDRLDIRALAAAHATFTLSDTSAGAMITFSTGETVSLLHVHASSLTVADGWIT